jgi:hypothetical protein
MRCPFIAKTVVNIFIDIVGLLFTSVHHTSLKHNFQYFLTPYILPYSWCIFRMRSHAAWPVYTSNLLHCLYFISYILAWFILACSFVLQCQFSLQCDMYCKNVFCNCIREYSYFIPKCRQRVMILVTAIPAFVLILVLLFLYLVNMLCLC